MKITVKDREALKNMCQQQHSSVAKYAYNRGLAEIKKYGVNYCVYNKDVIFIDHNCFIEKNFDKVYRNPPLFLCINDTKSDDPKIRLKFLSSRFLYLWMITLMRISILEILMKLRKLLVKI